MKVPEVFAWMDKPNAYVTFTRELISDQIFKPAQMFFRKEASSSILLLAATIMALVWTNTQVGFGYHDFWHIKLAISLGDFHLSKTLLHWINDGFMALFFFIIGLEIKREILVGELSSAKQALLPTIAALGGMVVPGLIYLFFNINTPTITGWGIPMATDIAFALGAVVIFGSRLPVGLRIFLAAFAIADDLGAVFIIALFYTQHISWGYLLICGFLTLGLALANFLWIRWTIVYAVLGLAIWFFILGSGIHPTVAGIIVSLFIPAKGRYDTDRFVQNVKTILNQFEECEEQSCGYSILLNETHMDAVHMMGMACHDVETPLQRLEYALHPWVAFLILPIFALSNSGITFQAIDMSIAFRHPASLGIFFGLVLGKPLGIGLFSYVAVKMGIATLPREVRWAHVLGVAFLGGIGFTMSLFILDLSFTSPELLGYAKMAILFGSLFSAIIGIMFLGMVSRISFSKTSN